MVYFLQISICWLAFYTLFFLLLRKETFFQLNRFYLLGTLILGLLIPILEIPVFEETIIAKSTNYLQTVTIGVQEFANAIVITPENAGETSLLSWQQILLVFYFSVMAFLALRFLYGLFQIFKLYKHSEITRHFDYQIVTTNSKHLPFSFFNLIFLNNPAFLTHSDNKKIMQHELAHIRQGHSFDVLFLEVLCIIFWWNPIVWFYRKSIREVHEFLADEAVLKTNNRKQYGQLLIQQSHLGMRIAIGNHFTQSQLKNRIMMMTKSKSKPQNLWKYLILMPMLAVLLLACQNEMTAQVKNIAEENPVTVVGFNNNKTHPIAKKNAEEKVFQEVDEMPRFPGCEDKKDPCFSKLVDFIVKEIKYPVEAKKADKEGTVVVSFVVETDGSLIDRKVVKSAGFGMDEEALRLFLVMPNWVPGKKDGKAVKVEMQLPIKFIMQPKHTQSDDKLATITIDEVDEMPFFAGCEEEKDAAKKRECANMKLLQFVYSNIKYPKEARKDGVDGMVVLSFVVTEDGSAEDPKIVRSVHPLCDAEVLRIANEMPVWEPAKKDGKAVAVEFKLPVKFKLEGDKKPIKAVENTLEMQNFRVFPNPATDRIDIELEFKELTKNYSIILTDSDGKEILNKNYENMEFKTLNIINFNISKAAKGAMIISIIDGKGKAFSDKVIVQ